MIIKKKKNYYPGRIKNCWFRSPGVDSFNVCALVMRRNVTGSKLDRFFALVDFEVAKTVSACLCKVGQAWATGKESSKKEKFIKFNGVMVHYEIRGYRWQARQTRSACITLWLFHRSTKPVVFKLQLESCCRKALLLFCNTIFQKKSTERLRNITYAHEVNQSYAETNKLTIIPARGISAWTLNWFVAVTPLLVYNRQSENRKNRRCWKPFRESLYKLPSLMKVCRKFGPLQTAASGVPISTQKNGVETIA